MVSSNIRLKLITLFLAFLHWNFSGVCFSLSSTKLVLGYFLFGLRNGIEIKGWFGYNFLKCLHLLLGDKNFSSSYVYLQIESKLVIGQVY